MAAKQTVLFTIIPRAISVDTPTMPVSVFVSPRLMGETTLGQFPDWLRWTERLQTDGLVLVVRCAGQSFDAPIDTEVLRPELWSQLFNSDTLVRSHKFEDYSQRGIISYSVRQALSALKTRYSGQRLVAVFDPLLGVCLPGCRGDVRRLQPRARARGRQTASGIKRTGRTCP